MFCNQCGNQVPDGVSFCPNCGAPVAQADPAPASEPQYAQPVEPQYAQPAEPQYAQPAQPQYAQPVEPQYAQPAQPQYPQPQYSQPVYGEPMPPVGDAQERELAKQNLIFGILAIAFACTFYLSFMGIIFGAISMGKAKAYAASYPMSGKAKVGSILGKVGFILGIVLTVISVITIIACSVASCANSYSSYYYY